MSGTDDTIGGVPTAPATRSPPMIGGRYLVHKLIARGGMASVFLGEHVDLHRRVAIKILHPPVGLENSEDANFQQRFKLEAETLAALNHPNIVTLFDYGQTEDGRFFLAMEYIDGPRYTDLVSDGPLGADRAITLLLQVCAALRYAHKRGVVHRDLKPSNLLIARDADGADTVKVVDFGLVKVGEVDQALTREGLVLGSPHCMAPEQVQGLPIDHRADIYALGILLYRSLTGCYPFHGSTATATMMAHLSEPIPAFGAVAPQVRVAPRIEQIVRRCLAKKVDERYPDIATLAADLHQAIGLVPEPEASQSLNFVEEPPAPVRPSARPLPWIPLAALAAVTVAAIAWFVLRESPAPVAVRPPEATPVEAALELAPSAPEVEPATAPADPATEAAPPPEGADAPPAPASKPAAGKPAAGKPAAGKPAAGKPAASKPATGEPTAPAEPSSNPEGYMPLPDDLR